MERAPQEDPYAIVRLGPVVRRGATFQKYTKRSLLSLANPRWMALDLEGARNVPGR
jgi:hypothetical protein